MAEFLPFKGVYFRDEFFNEANLVPGALSKQDSQTNHLKEKNNYSAHLVFPDDLNAGSDYFRSLLNSNVLLQERVSVFYTIKQEYKIPGNNTVKVKEGVVGLLKILSSEDVIKTHENVIDNEVESLAEYFKITGIQSSIATGFYHENADATQDLVRKSLVAPIKVIKNQTSKVSFGKIENPDHIAIIQTVVNRANLFLADGHHRLAALKSRSSADSPVYLMIMLINTAFSNLTVLPIHRTYKGLNFSCEDLLERAKEDFFIEPIEENVTKLPDKRNFYFACNNKLFKLSLKPEKVSEITWSFPEVIKSLDHTIIHFFLFEKYLGIKGRDQKKVTNINFCFIFTDCINKAKKGLVDFAVVLGEVDLGIVVKTAESGFTFPQKSTYFYPKLPSGLVFASVSNSWLKYSGSK